MERNIRLAYLASGSGTSVEALATKIKDRRLTGYTSAVVLCNKPEGEAKVYERAKALGIPTFHAPSTKEQLEILEREHVDIILGLGWVIKVGDPILQRYEDRVLNIHPTLLPRHGGKGMYGLETHLSVLRAGDTQTGPTVHLMNKEYDKGRILQQTKIPVPEELQGKPTEENAKQLQQIVLVEEYKLMPTVLKQIREGTIEIGRFDWK